MDLHPDVQRQLEAWLLAGNLISGHWADEQRWYDFVDLYQKHHGFTLYEQPLIDHATATFCKEENEENLDSEGGRVIANEIQEHVSLARKILDFLEHTGR